MASLSPCALGAAASSLHSSTGALCPLAVVLPAKMPLDTSGASDTISDGPECYIVQDCVLHSCILPVVAWLELLAHQGTLLGHVTPDAVLQLFVARLGLSVARIWFMAIHVVSIYRLPCSRCAPCGLLKIKLYTLRKSRGFCKRAQDLHRTLHYATKQLLEAACELSVRRNRPHNEHDLTFTINAEALLPILGQAARVWTAALWNEARHGRGPHVAPDSIVACICPASSL